MEKVALITGASRGIGRACAIALAKRGYDIAVNYNSNDAKAQEVVDEITSLGRKAIAYKANTADLTAVKQMFRSVVKDFGKLDVLVNNAGMMDDMAPIGEMSDDRLQKVYALNVFGPAYAMRKAVNVFLAQESGGSIINVASLGCVKAVAGPVYCSSKAALVSMSKNTAFMYMPQKIRVNVIAPGGIATEISSSMGMPNMGGYARVQKVLAAAPEVGKAEDVAAAALFFASDDSSYISGDVMYVDGGWNAG